MFCLLFERGLVLPPIRKRTCSDDEGTQSAHSPSTQNNTQCSLTKHTDGKESNELKTDKQIKDIYLPGCCGTVSSSKDQFYGWTHS